MSPGDRRLPYGFKADCDRLAVEVRVELGFAPTDPLDPFALAAHLDVPLRALSSMRADPEASGHFLGQGGGEFSAVTLVVARRRCVIYNDGHNPERQRSDIMHELAHALLHHPATPPLTSDGIRSWNSSLEHEAAELAGHLLVPDDAAIRCALKAAPVSDCARKYGVSIELMTWRVRTSGGSSIVARSRRGPLLI